MGVPNQKHIIIKKSPCNKENIYAMINIDALNTAMNDLKGELFKLWVYFAKNQDNYNFDLSQKAATEWGLKRSAYYDNVDKLIEKGYLQQKDSNSNIFYFTEKPFSEIRKECEKEIIDFSEKRKEPSEIQKEISDFQQRNNTNNNIDIIQYKETKKGGNAAKYKEKIEKTLNQIEEDYYNNKFDERQLTIFNKLFEYVKINGKSEDKQALFEEIYEYYQILYDI